MHTKKQQWPQSENSASLHKGKVEYKGFITVLASILSPIYKLVILTLVRTKEISGKSRFSSVRKHS